MLIRDGVTEHRQAMNTIWLFNIAMENPHF